MTDRVTAAQEAGEFPVVCAWCTPRAEWPADCSHTICQSCLDRQYTDTEDTAAAIERRAAELSAAAGRRTFCEILTDIVSVDHEGTRPRFVLCDGSDIEMVDVEDSGCVETLAAECRWLASKLDELQWEMEDFERIQENRGRVG